MVDILKYIRNLIYTPTDNRKRRTVFEDLEQPSSKISRIHTINSFPNMEDDKYLSFNNPRRRNNIRSYNIGLKSKPVWSKENVTVTIDDEDDDDVVEVPQRSQIWSDILRKSDSKLPVTSTPNFALSSKANNLQNGDEDVTFMKYIHPSRVKKAPIKKRECNLSNNLNRNGGTAYKPKDFTSPILSSVKEIKTIINRSPVPIRSRTMEQSFRLDEKQKYKQMLEQAVPNCMTSHRSFLKYNAPGGRLCNNEKIIHPTTARGFTTMTNFNKIAGNDKKKPISTKDTIKKVLDEFEEPIVIKDSDSDIEIVPSPPSPKPDIHVPRVNTLQPLLEASTPVHVKWLRNLISKHKKGLNDLEDAICLKKTHRDKLSTVNAELQAQKLNDTVQRCLYIKDQILPLRFTVDALPELSTEEEIIIDKAVNTESNPSEVVSHKFNLNITRRDIQTLTGLQWLNDEVINFYMNLLIERGKGSNWTKAYAMNTFFYLKLQKDGPLSLKRWTRRIDVFSYDVIVVPIHLGMHWCMSVIDFRDCTIKYYDSMGSSNRQCLEALRNYLKVEHLDKKQEEYDVSLWKLENVKDIPQQMNGSDCGVFACTYAEYITRNADLTFSQEDMPYIRRKMILEILYGKLLVQ